MSKLPALFVSHGSPMLLLDGGPTLEAWRAVAAAVPRPRAIVAVSAHWATGAPAVGAAERPSTIHDFGGFPQPLYALEYPAPGAPWLAQRVVALLEAAGMPATIDDRRGLDHGAWVPLSVMYPDAGVPVVQLALQPRLGPAHHYRVGRTLAELRDEGVLILASGSLTHNLHDLVWGAGEDREHVPGYVPLFQRWVHDRLLANDTAALLDYRRQAPQAARAHPTEEHLLPLHVALGAGDGGQPQRHHAAITDGALAMDVYLFGDSPATTAQMQQRQP